MIFIFTYQIHKDFKFDSCSKTFFMQTTWRMPRSFSFFQPRPFSCLYSFGMKTEVIFRFYCLDHFLSQYIFMAFKDSTYYNFLLNIFPLLISRFLWAHISTEHNLKKCTFFSFLSYCIRYTFGPLTLTLVALLYSGTL